MQTSNLLQISVCEGAAADPDNGPMLPLTALVCAAAAAPPSPPAASPNFEFSKLLSRARPADGAPFVYNVESTEGQLFACSLREVRAFAELKAAPGEAAWACTSCTARDFSLARALICAECGAPSPSDELDLAQLKRHKREEMAAQQPRFLTKHGVPLRIITGRPDLTTVRLRDAHRAESCSF